eukprot:3589394-Pleurochrysis_carterae.AAC.1
MHSLVLQAVYSTSCPCSFSQLIGVCLEGPEYLLICPFCEGGTLAGRHAMLLKKRSPPIATAVL